MILDKKFGYELKLVDAHTKIPFPEHRKNGRNYVEVEPKAEYMLSLQKIGPSYCDMILEGFVDDQILGWESTSYKEGRDANPVYRGKFITTEEGVDKQRVLKFAPAQKVVPSATPSGNPTTQQHVGTVKLKFHSMKMCGDANKRQKVVYYEKSVKNVATGKTANEIHDKKIVGTEVSYSNPIPLFDNNGEEGGDDDDGDDEDYYDYNFGKHLRTFTLYYTTTPGLIRLGILPPPLPRGDGTASSNSNNNNKEPVIPIEDIPVSIIEKDIDDLNTMKYRLYDLTSFD